MARTVYFPDGSSEVLFCGDDPDKQKSDLERILTERLGSDTVSLFHEIVDPITNGVADMEWELKSYESSMESYRSCLQEVFDGLGEIAAMLAADKRLDRKKVDAILCTLLTQINNEL